MSGKLPWILLGLALLLLITVPYLVGFQASDGQFQFGGFLINPIDGNSYLAKMQLGYHGSWKFQLPYTSDPGEGAYLFLFYIFLGHFARLTGISLIAVFHGARVIAAGWLLIMIRRFLRLAFKKENWALTSFALAIFGSGLGWLAVLFGKFTSDFWVAEAYPFLSMYTNPHFTLGFGLMIYALLPGAEGSWIRSALAALALALIQPFGVAILCLIKVVQASVKILDGKTPLKEIHKNRWFWPVLAYCLAGGSVLLYQFGVILSDPVLSQWHLQNITARPAPLDLVISLLPAMALGPIAVKRAWRTDLGRSMVIWASICLVLVFIPWSLQRRFLAGIYFPLAVLSVFGLQVLQDKGSRWSRFGVILIFFLAVPTNLIVVTSGIQAISEKNPGIFIEDGLAESLQWIREKTSLDELILTDDTAGLYVPAWTGRRVIYGHPFETVRAEERLVEVEQLFLEEQQAHYYETVMEEGNYELVLINQKGSGSFADWLEENWRLGFRSGEYCIYQKR